MKTIVMIVAMFLLGFGSLKMYHVYKDNTLLVELNEKRRVYYKFYSSHNYNFDFSKETLTLTSKAAERDSDADVVLLALAMQLDEYESFSKRKGFTYNQILDYYNNY